MVFKRDNLKNKKSFYFILIVVEILIYLALIYSDVHWLLLIFIFPFLIIEIISNKRCLNRERNFIKELGFLGDKLECVHVNTNKTFIQYEDLIFSFREVKFEKNKSEIEIKKKGRFRNKLIGRIHIKNWNSIFEIKKEFLKKEITRAKFKPEGFWSKYGGFTADVVIAVSAVTLDGVSDVLGNGSSSLEIQTDFSSLHKNHKKEN